jgi:uncharacterized protein YjiK
MAATLRSPPGSLLGYLLGVFFIACNTPTPMQLPYSFDRPDKIFALPPELVEISGLSLSADEQHLIAVQDEWGHLFKIDRQTGAVLPSIPFGAEGDYEGIEFVEPYMYVVNSNGTIFQLTPTDQSAALSLSPFPTFLNSTYDVEGLGYDKETHSLLLACKEHPGNSDDRMVFAFSLAEKQLLQDPVLRIRQTDIRACSGRSDITFKPSGIARHPQTGAFYILSAAADMLLIMTAQGQITHCLHLPKELYQQPEGICFSSDGTLYISDEGNKKKSGSVKVFFPKG